MLFLWLLAQLYVGLCELGILWGWCHPSFAIFVFVAFPIAWNITNALYHRFAATVVGVGLLVMVGLCFALSFVDVFGVVLASLASLVIADVSSLYTVF